jgi:hypothetical protein
MANPNIVNVSTISGRTNAVVANVALTTACANPISSGKIIKVNTISLANKTTATTEVTLQFKDYSQSNATFNIAKTIDVPSESTIFAVDKNTVIYLEEGDAIVCSAVSGSTIDVIVSFEEIS